MVLDVQRRLCDISKRPCDGIVEISPFLMTFPNLPVLVELGVASLPDWRSVTHCTCISPGTPLHATRLAQGFASLFYQEGEGEEVTAGDARLLGFFFSRLGSTEGDSPSPQNVSLSHMQPKGLLD